MVPCPSISLVLDGCFMVSSISVHPVAALKLQSHYHWYEHWVVVDGPAKLTIGDKIRLVTGNKSVNISVSEKHPLKKIPARRR